uniref:Uncharacterized protein n=1 Tax=Anopheles maculatus TaxID=74869 RepID=A0A182T489_9DIPT
MYKTFNKSLNDLPFQTAATQPSQKSSRVAANSRMLEPLMMAKANRRTDRSSHRVLTMQSIAIDDNRCNRLTIDDGQSKPQNRPIEPLSADDAVDVLLIAVSKLLEKTAEDGQPSSNKPENRPM